MSFKKSGELFLKRNDRKRVQAVLNKKDLFQLNCMFDPMSNVPGVTDKAGLLYPRTILSSLNSAATSFPLRCQCTPGSAISHPTL